MPFSIDINFVDEVKWDESKHKRGQPGNAGQFGSGGGSAKGKPYPKNTSKYHVKAMGLLENVVKYPYGTQVNTAEKIKEIVSGYGHPTIAAYGNSLLKWLEAEHGMSPGDLGKAISKNIPPEKKKQFKATLAKIAKSPEPREEEAKISGATSMPSSYQIEQIDKIILTASNPVHAAVAIKKLGVAGGGYAAPEVQAHVKHTLAELLKWYPGKEKELKQVMGVAPSTSNKVYAPGTFGAEPAGPTPRPPRDKPAESPKQNPYLPQPNAGSEHQKKLYDVAVKAFESGGVYKAIEEIKAYPTVSQYPDGYTAKYASELVVAMGGEPITKPIVPTPSTPKPSAPTPSVSKPKPTTPVAVLKPTKPSKSWQVAQARYEAAYKPYHNNSWDQDAAEQCFASAPKAAWNALQKESGGKLNAAVISYGGSGYGQINSALRDDAGASQDAIDMAVTIDNAFSEPEAAILKDTVIIRGTNLTSTFVDKLKSGLKNNKPTRFPLDGFSSCSFSKEPPNIGAKHKYWLEIVATKGTPLLSATNAVGSHEREVLLRHGQSYEVLEVEDNWESPSHGTKTRIRCITV